MIFPVYANNKIDGLAIYFRNYGNYIKTSSKAPNTIRNWIMKHIFFQLRSKLLIKDIFHSFITSFLNLVAFF